MNRIAPKPPEEDHALRPGKFENPAITVDGQVRATVALTALKTLWLNTGTLCNLTCTNCYIESSPTNDRLSYISAAESRRCWTNSTADWKADEIGFTGGEPFMIPRSSRCWRTRCAAATTSWS